MSNRYLLHHMVLNSQRFFERLKRLYDDWKNSDVVDCIMIVVGDDNRSICSKSAALHIWLFGYELNDTVCVFTRDTVYILSGKKEIEFLEPLENHMDTDENKSDVKLSIFDWNDDKNVTNLLNVMVSSQNGKPIGVCSLDGFPGQFGMLWQTAMTAHNFETTDISASIARVMTVKDEYELNTIKEASRVSVDIFENYLKQNISEMAEAKKRIRHSLLAENVAHALTNKKFISDADTSQLECCYSPIIQSGAAYDLKFTAGSNDAYLDFGVILCSLGVRYKSYCSNISRTLLIKPSETIQENHNFLLDLEKQLLNSLVPGARLNEIYQAALDYAKSLKPHLVAHLTKTFGSAIGIEFHECSLTISPKCMAIVKKGMAFNVCIGLDRLINNNDGKSYALLHSNTVIVNDFSSATSLTLPPAYLKLNADCLEHIFDYLSFHDIMSLAQTGIRMQQMAGYYIREYFPELKYNFDDGKIYVEYNDKKYTVPVDFWRYIETLAIKCELDFSLDAEKFPSLHTLILCDTLDETQLGYIRSVLKSIEDIYLSCEITDNAFEHLSECCPNLNSLKIDCCDDEDDRLNAIFLQHFPSLEYLQYVHTEFDADIRIDEIKTFLENHTKLTHFDCDDSFLWRHKDLFSETKLQLDWFKFSSETTNIQSDQFADLLQRLYKSGFFKRLSFTMQIFGENFDYDILSDAISKWPALEKMHIDSEHSQLDVTRLVSLKELEFGNDYPNTHFDLIAKSLVKLERLSLNLNSIGDIWPFICHCKLLKSIEIHKFNSDDDLNLVALNQERKKFGENATQVWIYVPEDTYLREKWNSQNVGLSHVKITRLDFNGWTF